MVGGTVTVERGGRRSRRPREARAGVPASRTRIEGWTDLPGEQTRPRLLIVEDDAASADAMRALFVRRGWEVRVAGSVGEALPLVSGGAGLRGEAKAQAEAKADAQGDAWPDWVVLDLMLPDGDGEAVLEAIRAGGVGVRVVVATGVYDERRIAALARLSPDAVYHKPIDVKRLLRLMG
jgi:DNA-binding response OmpR family regulator